MKPYEELARATTPDGRRLTLSEHCGDYYIDVDGQALMSTRAPGSERALADQILPGLAAPRPHVLIGGLGLGFTLGAALDVLPAEASVTVVEVFEAVVDWNRKYSFDSANDRLADERVAVEVRDVVDVLSESRSRFDAILLDVDNGPDAWSLDSNDRLYDAAGLARIRRALRPAGVLAVWSSIPSREFERKLVEAGFRSETASVRSRGRKGERHTIFTGRI